MGKVQLKTKRKNVDGNNGKQENSGNLNGDSESLKE